jgi:hypothetical protein
MLHLPASRDAIDPRYAVAAGVASEPVGEELLLVHLGRGGAFQLNRTARTIWQLAGDGFSAAQIAERLSAAHGVSLPEMQRDSAQLLVELVRHALLEPRAGPAA